jgi:hypothetical protein
VEPYLLAIQARVLLGVSVGWLLLGIVVLGQDPLTVAWRAVVGACVAMIVVGWLLRQVAGVIEERLALDLAERQLTEEQARAQHGSAGNRT